ncbi:uncharacterized protein ARMOST_21941 [Armillaria ostoyae]|uniref:F-box domain-containing protein n=1 Tax=Armillaria ostoyae TaxID=47428 RepID=A0A284SBH7_ARMOS|nr:uncharacterized protein ARMOST_21941 [Armillaria ostoyae]
MPFSDLPPEIFDAIIDDLQDDKKSLLKASLACKAFYPRTRVYLFSVASLSSAMECSCFHELITQFPQLALHFKSLKIAVLYPSHTIPPSSLYGALSVIEFLVNVTHLSLRTGDWRYMPDSVVSSLQSRSYRSLEVNFQFYFRSMGEICSLLKNSPNLQQVRIDCRNSSIAEIQECDVDHSVHRTAAPAMVHIGNLEDDAGALLKSILSSRSCPFSCSNIHTLHITSKTSLPQCLNQHLSHSPSSLKHLYIFHPYTGTIQLGKLHISGVEQITVVVFRQAQIFEWWISNFSAVNEDCAISSIAFKILVYNPNLQEGHPALGWEDIWTRLGGCLTSSKMASLKRVAITFDPQPADWDILKAEMEEKFLGLKKLGCEVILVARRHY